VIDAPRASGAPRLFLLAALVSLGAAGGLAAPVVRAALPVALVAAVCAILRPRWATLGVCAVALGWLVATLRITAVDDALLIGLAAHGERTPITGVVVAPPQRIADETTLTVRLTSLTLEATTVGSRERISLIVRAPPWGSGDDQPSYEVGDALAVDDVALRPLRAGGVLRRIASLRARISARAFVDPEDVARTGVGGGPLLRIARWGRGAVRAAAAPLPGQSRALLLGITIGDTSELGAQTVEDFKRTGLTHLVAVSGANLAIVLVGLLLILRALRTPVRAIPWLLAVATISFCAISAFEPSVVRAGLMALLGLLAFAMGAARRALELLALGVLIATLIDPFLAFTFGFQLSVAATLGLVTIARRLQEHAGERPVLVAGGATLGAQLATMPLLALMTGRLAVISLPANLIVAPLVAPATILGLGAALGSIVPPLRYLAHATRPVLATMLLLARLLADLPGAIVDVPGGPAGIVVIVALIALAVVATKGRYRRATVLVAVALLIPLAAGLWSAANKPPKLDGLTITMIDVGQGESILVTEGDHAMLIDGGRDADDVPRFLRDRGIHRLDYLVVSHAHDDHLSGLVGVAERATIGAILDPSLPADLDDYEDLLEIADERNIARTVARAGQTYPLGDATITILWPAEPLLDVEDDLNENSIVLRIDIGSDAFLYAGETQEISQRALLERGAPLRAEVLKVSHHGSGNMHPDFYRATGAQVAMIPVGPNSYGHPAPETLLALTGMRVLRSDEHGDIEVTLDGLDHLAVRTER
jgi:competence protein ComEC